MRPRSFVRIVMDDTLPATSDTGSLATSMEGLQRKPTPPEVDFSVRCAAPRKMDHPAFLCFLANSLR